MKPRPRKLLSGLWNALAQNFALKVLALMGAIGLFTVVHGSEAAQRSLFVPVVAELPDPSVGKVLVSDLPDRVKLTLSGSRSVLNSIESVDAVAINLSAADQYYYFEPEAFGLPAGIDVKVVPSTLVLDWEDRIERTLTVRPQRVGELPEGLELTKEPRVSPRTVRVSGPRSVVQTMSEVMTDPVDVAVAGVGEHVRRVRISSLPPGVQMEDVRDVAVRFAVSARENERRIERLEVATLGHTAPVAVRPVHVNVVLGGSEAPVAALDEEHVVPVVNLEGFELTPGSSQAAKVEVRGLPAGVRVVRIEPPEVLVSPGRSGH